MPEIKLKDLPLLSESDQIKFIVQYCDKSPTTVRKFFYYVDNELPGYSLNKYWKEIFKEKYDSDVRGVCQDIKELLPELEEMDLPIERWKLGERRTREGLRGHVCRIDEDSKLCKILDKYEHVEKILGKHLAVKRLEDEIKEYEKSKEPLTRLRRFVLRKTLGK